MEIRVKLQEGPITVEVFANEDEDYESEITGVLDLLDENVARLESYARSPEKANFGRIDSELDGVEANTEEEEIKRVDESNVADDDSPLQPLSELVDVPISKLEGLIDVNPEAEEYPILYVEDLDLLGNSRVERQRRASLIILLSHRECYGEERMLSSDLKDSLVDSGVDEQSMFKMYQGKGERYFDTKGRGPSATLALKRPGRREAKKEIRNLIDEVR